MREVSFATLSLMRHHHSTQRPIIREKSDGRGQTRYQARNLGCIGKFRNRASKAEVHK
jgi:hypothetical protein